MQQTTDIEALWRNRLPFIQRLVATDARRVLTAAPDLASAFQLQKRSLTCIDGGITHGLHLAGSGVLLPDENLRKLVHQAKIEEFTTHDGCGAFHKACPGGDDRYAVAWGKSMAGQLGVPHRHISAAEMQRPVGFHDEVVAYFDLTGRFNRIPGLPPGFVISAHDFPDTAISDLQLAIEIALGHHGFSERFQPLTPFTVIVIEHPETPQYQKFDAAIGAGARTFNRRVQVQIFRTAWTLRDSN